jgi:hypothetical protein
MVAYWGVATALLFFAAYAMAAEPQRVLFLHFFGPNFEPWDTIAAYLRTDLAEQSPKTLDLYEASLQTARFSSTGQDAPFVGYLQALFRDHRPDLVVAIGGPAVRFVETNGHALFPSTPTLFSGVDERILQEFGPCDNCAAVTVSIDIQQLARIYSRCRPRPPRWL